MGHRVGHDLATEHNKLEHVIFSIHRNLPHKQRKKLCCSTETEMAEIGAIIEDIKTGVIQGITA